MDADPLFPQVRYHRVHEPGGDGYADGDFADRAGFHCHRFHSPLGAGCGRRTGVVGFAGPGGHRVGRRAYSNSVASPFLSRCRSETDFRMTRPSLMSSRSSAVLITTPSRWWEARADFPEVRLSSLSREYGPL